MPERLHNAPMKIQRPEIFLDPPFMGKTFVPEFTQEPPIDVSIRLHFFLLIIIILSVIFCTHCCAACLERLPMMGHLGWVADQVCGVFSVFFSGLGPLWAFWAISWGFRVVLGGIPTPKVPYKSSFKVYLVMGDD